MSNRELDDRSNQGQVSQTITGDRNQVAGNNIINEGDEFRPDPTIIPLLFTANNTTGLGCLFPLIYALSAAITTKLKKAHVLTNR